MNRIELKKKIDEAREIIKKINDDDLKFDLIEKFGVIKKLSDEINELTISQKTISQENYDTKKKRFQVAEKIRSLDKNSTYLDDFVRLLSEAPFTLPSNYFEPETALTTNLDMPESSHERYKTERTELALQICFPGSTTFRYGLPRKILCGDFSRNYQVDLRSRHDITTTPEEFQINGREVYFVKTLRTQRSFYNQIFVCPICLSADKDEKCDHTAKKMALSKLPSSFPIKQHVEVSRKSSRTPLVLPEPLCQMIDSVTFLDEIKIGTAFIGFNRTVGNTTTTVDYDPYIGYVTQTKGISFSLKNVDEEFLDEILHQNYLVRDLIIDLIFTRITNSLKENNIPRYHVELFLSSFIKANNLDNIQDDFDYLDVISSINSGEWISGALRELQNEQAIYGSRIIIPPDVPQKVFSNIIQTTLDKVTLKIKIKKLLANSLSHTIFLAGCTTSGSLYDDLDYSINYDENDNPIEVLLFDATNGGNGASELIYNYLILPSKKSSEITNTESYLRPRHFDETFFEILLPCSQGITDRIHFQTVGDIVQDNQLVKLIKHTRDLANESQTTFNRIKNSGIINTFPLSIGLRQLNEDEPIRETEKMREMASICIHGCPDCISLGSRAKPDQFAERYSISKYMLDLFFRFKSSHLIHDSNSSFNEIRKTIENYGLAILHKKISKSSDYDDFDNDVSRLIGKSINEQYVKLAGKWYDCQISRTPNLESFCALGIT